MSKALYLGVALLALGCGARGQKPADAAAPARVELTPEERARFTKLGGQELAADAALTKGAAPKHVYEQCLTSYANLLELQAAQKPGADLVGPAMLCKQTCVAGGADFDQLVQKYRARCEGQTTAAVGDIELELARRSLADLRSADSPAWKAAYAKGTGLAIDKARAKLGADHAGLGELEAEFRAFTAQHKADIAKGDAFLNSAKIVDLLAELREVEQELENYRQHYQKNPTDAWRKLIRAKEERIQTLKARFDEEGRKAGVVN